MDGNNLMRLTSANATWPTCSPDGRWVVYSSASSDGPSLWKVPFEGGDPIQLTRNTFVHTAPSISPDGTMIAFADRDQPPASPVKIVVIPFEGGDPIKTFDLPPLLVSTFRCAGHRTAAPTYGTRIASATCGARRFKADSETHNCLHVRSDIRSIGHATARLPSGAVRQPVTLYNQRFQMSVCGWASDGPTGDDQ